MINNFSFNLGFKLASDATPPPGPASSVNSPPRVIHPIISQGFAGGGPVTTYGPAQLQPGAAAHARPSRIVNYPSQRSQIGALHANPGASAQLAGTSRSNPLSSVNTVSAENQPQPHVRDSWILMGALPKPGPSEGLGTNYAGQVRGSPYRVVAPADLGNLNTGR